MQTDAKQSGQVWGISDRSDPIRFAAKGLMSQWPMQGYGACSRCFRVKHHRRYRSDTVHVYHKGEIRRSLHCIMGNQCSGCSSYLAFTPIWFKKMVPGSQPCRCCNGGMICSAHNPGKLEYLKLKDTSGSGQRVTVQKLTWVSSLCNGGGGESDC